MSTMTMVQVGDLGEIYDGPHATPQRLERGRKYFLNIGSLVDGRLDLAQSDFVGEEEFARWTRRVTPREGDLLFSYETRLGDAALMPPHISACLGRRMALLRPDPNVVDARFLLYAWLSPQFQSEIRQRAIHGATVSRIPLVELPQWPFALPDLGVQRAVGEVLGALDDKIATNRRILNAADDLVRANYARLPASENVVLGDIARSVRQQVGAAEIGVNAVYVGLEHFDRERLWLQRFGAGGDVTSAKNAFETGDTLFGKLRPYFHKVGVAPESGVCSTDILVIRALDERTRWLVAAASGSSEAIARAVQNSNGTRMPRAKWEDIADLAVPDPASREVAAFEAWAEALGKRCFAAVVENETLAKTRDELLPLLMSGRITVKDAVKRVEGVA